MRELDCDFCGAAAAGAYEVGPAPPDRSPSDRRRLVLCADCRATLADAIRPLLDRLAAAEGEGPTDEDGNPAGESDESVGTDDRTVGESGESVDGGDTSVDPLGGGGATGESESTVSGVTDEATTTGRADTATDETGARTAATDAESDETVEASGSTDASGPAGTDGSTDTSESTDASGSTDTSESTDTSGSAGAEPPSEEPPEFRKVVRLLNNRSFPVDRAEFVELAAGAYDLEESTVTESLAYAVDRGVLAVEDGQIVRG